MQGAGWISKGKAVTQLSAFANGHRNTCSCIELLGCVWSFSAFCASVRAWLKLELGDGELGKGAGEDVTLVCVLGVINCVTSDDQAKYAGSGCDDRNQLHCRWTGSSG